MDKVFYIADHFSAQPGAAQHEVEKIRTAYQQLQFILDHVANAITIQDSSGALVYVNDAAARICGFPDAATMLGTPHAEIWSHFELLDEHGQPASYEQLPGRLALAGVPDPPAVTVCFRTIATGDCRWSTVRAIPIVDRDGQVVGAINSWHDVTDLKQRELALAAERDYFASILASVGDGVIVTNPQGVITLLNASAETLIGWSQAEAVGRPLVQVLRMISEETGQPIEDPVTSVLRSGQVRGTGTQALLLTKDGRAIPIHATGSPIKDAQHQLQGLVLAFRDTTEQREAARRNAEQAEILEIINSTGQLLAGELDLDTLVQATTDAITTLVGAEFGSFFYNVVNEQGEAYTLYTISGVPREAFSSFPMPRSTKVFKPTFYGEGIVRSDDITRDSRYGQNPPYNGMPSGHLPVRSYLAVPVISRSGEVLGGLFFGHSQPGVFTERAEQLVGGLVAQTAVAMDNARLFAALQRERQQLQASEQNYRTLAEAIPQMVFTGRADGYIDYANERWCEYTGLSLAQTQASGWVDALHPDDRKRTLSRWTHSVHTGEIYEVVYRFRRAADGMYRWHIGRAYPLTDGEGQIIKWFGTCTDIHDQKQLAEGMQFLADASAVLSTSLNVAETFEQLAQLVVPRFGDWCGVYLVGDDGLLRPDLIHHHDAEQAAYVKGLFERYPPRPHSNSLVYQVLESGESQLLAVVTPGELASRAEHVEQQRMLQTLRINSLLVVPLKTTTATLGVLTIATSDPTRQYTVDDQAIAVELGRRAALAIENAQLYRETQQALLSRDQFFSIAAHELKTPMTAILGYAQLLERRAAHENVPAKERRPILAIVEQVRRLHRLTLTLLDLSRIQEGTLTLERQPIDLVQLLQRLVSDLQPTVERHQLSFEALMPTCTLDADELRLEQVFQNLIQNAIKYSPSGGVIHITLAPAEREVMVTIRDQGIGIPAQNLPKLFQRYYRAENVAEYRLTGMGLGLYIVKEIVSMLEGRVEVESQEGQGSAFTVYLPLG